MSVFRQRRWGHETFFCNRFRPLRSESVYKIIRQWNFGLSEQLIYFCFFCRELIGKWIFLSVSEILLSSVCREVAQLNTCINKQCVRGLATIMCLFSFGAGPIWWSELHPRCRRAAGQVGLVDINMLTGRCHPGQLGRRPSEGPWQRARKDTLRLRGRILREWTWAWTVDEPNIVPGFVQILEMYGKSWNLM